MIKIIILNDLRNEIFKTFKKESLKIYKLIKELKNNPNKGKVIGHVGKTTIRELKYQTFRFYFLIESDKLILFNSQNLQDLLIKFVKMSKKNNQQKAIDEIKQILSKIGFKDIK